MNKVIGIIAEYNPFHNGHKWQITKARTKLGQVPVVAIMSGNFTQRGTPALLNKWSRAQMAVHGGVDLVLELPFLAACKSAEFFALGSVEILNATNIVTHLCFGAEHDDVNLLTNIAQKACEADFSFSIKDYLGQGNTYARAVHLSTKKFFPDISEQAALPNSILAIEYIKTLIKTNSKIQPLAIKRHQANHLDKQIISDIASATAIRNSLWQDKFSDITNTVPETSLSIIKNALQHNELYLDDKIYEKILFYRLRQLTNEQIKAICDVSEGLENKIKKAAQTTTCLSDLIDEISSKRYVKTRILRILSQLLVIDNGVQKNSFYPYIRILAFNDTGRELIKKISQNSCAPLITNLPDFYKKNTCLEIKHSLDVDINATDVFQLLIDKNNAGMDFLQKPAYL